MRKKLTLICIMAALCAPTAVFGEVLQIGDGQTVSVKGTAQDKNAPIAIEVYAGDKTAADLEELSKEEYGSILFCHDQATTDKDGNYSFEFDINGRSGEYTVFLATDKTALPSEKLIFVSLDDYNKIAETIKTDDAAKIKDYILNDTYTIGLTTEDVASVDVSKLASVLCETIKTSQFDETKRSELLDVVHKALYVERLNEKKIADVFAEDNSLTGIDDSLIKDWYTKEYVTDDLKKNFNERISGKNFANYADYSEKMVDAFILATVQYPNGSGNVEDIVKAFADRIGVNTSKAKSSTWTKLAGENYSNLDGLKDGFNSNVSTSSSSSSSGGSGSRPGSSGGSSNKGINSIVGGIPVAMDKSNEKLPAASFSDIDSVEWAKDAILYLAENEIISGYGDGTFAPNANVRREEFTKIVVAAFAEDAEEADISFKDVADDAWYATYVKKAFGAKIVNGVSEDMFGTGLPITRQDLCVMVYNAAVGTGKIIEIDTPQELFADDDSIAEYAKKAVYALRANGIVSGLTEDEFAPSENATRAQAARIIYSVLKK